MEANKENLSSGVERSKTTRDFSTTRIPVPMEPLPLLPKHLIKNTNQARPALKTIDLRVSVHNKINICNENVASSSFQVQKVKEETKLQKKVTLKSCVRHVITYTKMKGNWAKNVFKDDIDTENLGTGPLKTESKEVIFDGSEPNLSETYITHDIAFVISDDDEDETVLNVKEEKKNTLLVVKSEMAATPAAIEHKGIRNIKKSLKRPHSRELQGRSPVAVVKDTSAEEKVKRRLMFGRLENRVVAPDVWKELYTRCLSKDYNIFNYLLLVESKPYGAPHIASITRACIINWFIKMNGPEGNPAVIQSACWYLDSYLSTKEVPLVSLQVVGAACYWVAQKLHGPMFSASKMVVCANNAFTHGGLRAAEVDVLLVLNFPRQPVVSQEFITYLSWWCDVSHAEEIEVAATFLCMAGMIVDKSLCAEFPSAIAAVAVKTAVLLLGKSHLMKRLVLCPAYEKGLLKTSNPHLPTILRRAVRTLGSPLYEYKVLLEHYNLPPYFIAEKIVEATKWLAVQEPQYFRKDSVSYKL